MEDKVLDIVTVNECNRCLGGRLLHPQASLIDLKDTDLSWDSVKFEFYTILLIEDCTDGCSCCGRRYYDFSKASMVFLKPGEIFRMSASDLLPKRGRLLAFHPDILSREGLYGHINDYTFFSYNKQEALHLSHKEKGVVTKILQDIAEELNYEIDRHSGTLVSRLIELLLDYCARFYDRQFITREEKNKTIMGKLDCILLGCSAAACFPTMEGCAAALNLSPAYFADLLKFTTGMTYSEYCASQTYRFEFRGQGIFE